MEKNKLSQAQIEALGQETLTLARSVYRSAKSLQEHDLKLIHQERLNLSLTLNACRSMSQVDKEAHLNDIQAEILLSHIKRLTARGEGLLKEMSQRLRNNFTAIG